MKVLVWIVIILALACAIVIGLAAKGPKRMRLQRSIEIHASPERVFSFINDLQKWEQWDSQESKSPVTRTFGAIRSGKGAVSEWVGSGSAGAGRMEIVDSAPPSSVCVNVDFRKPFTAHNINTFTLVPHAGGTTVTWTWDGSNVFLMRVMSVFVSPDKMMGEHFESGLRSLKRVAEE